MTDRILQISMSNIIEDELSSPSVIKKIKMLDFDIRTAQYFLTFSKTSRKIKNKEEFLSKIDDCVKCLKKDGRYTEIMNKYGLQN